MKKLTYSVLTALVVFAVACIPAHAKQQRRNGMFGNGIEGSFDRTLNVSAGADLEVSTGSGSIEIRRGSAGRVEIHGKIRAGTNWLHSDRDAENIVRELEANPPIEQSGRTIRIGRMTDRDSERNVSISYEITVPGDTPVKTSTGSGSITLTDVTGDVSATTGSGSIRATGLRGALRVHTGSGGIHVDGEQRGRWELETGSGGIDIRLPRGANFELSAHTGSGGVYVDYPMTVQGRVDRNRHDVSGRIGSGGYALNARTGSGHIRIE